MMKPQQERKTDQCPTRYANFSWKRSATISRKFFTSFLYEKFREITCCYEFQTFYRFLFREFNNVFFLKKNFIFTEFFPCITISWIIDDYIHSLMKCWRDRFYIFDVWQVSKMLIIRHFSWQNKYKNYWNTCFSAKLEIFLNSCISY